MRVYVSAPGAGPSILLVGRVVEAEASRRLLQASGSSHQQIWWQEVKGARMMAVMCSRTPWPHRPPQTRPPNQLCRVWRAGLRRARMES